MLPIVHQMYLHLTEIEIMGDDGLRYTPYRIVELSQNEQRVKELETHLQSRLPEDYREFLINVNGGQPIPGFDAIDDTKIPDIVLWYSLNRNTMYLDGDSTIEKLNKWNSDVRPAGLFEIANDSCGNSYCISLIKKHYGNIFYLDYRKRGRIIESDIDKWSLCEYTDDGFTSLCSRFLQGFHNIRL